MLDSVVEFLALHGLIFTPVAILFFASVAIGGVFLGFWMATGGRRDSEAMIALLEIERENLRSQITDAEVHLTRLRDLQLADARKIAELETSLKSTRENFNLITHAKEEFEKSFRAASSEALHANNQTFLDLAKASLEQIREGAKGDLDQRKQAIDNLVKPLQISLDKVDLKIQEIEKDRADAFATVREQMKSVAETEAKLLKETGNLVQALRVPNVRGRWGEVQLRRVVELAGMQEHCDFIEQESVSSEDGRLRPDLVVKLAGGKSVVVDAKTPLKAYVEAIEAVDDEGRRIKMADHARQVRNHMMQLSSKNYWSQFDQTPDFAVLFLPGDLFLGAALESDPELIEFGFQSKVILATPMTLMALLRTVAYGWRQHSMEENAQEISKLGKLLHDRLATLADHFTGLGKNLGQSVKAYNDAVGSLESRIFPAARRFKELGAADGKSIELVPQVERAVRDGSSSFVEAVDVSARLLTDDGVATKLDN